MAHPKLTDRHALALHRKRAVSRGDGMADFIHQIAADEIQERLKDVNRTFTSPAVVCAFPDLWAKFLPGFHLVQDQETLDLDDKAHDLIIHTMALHWADDPVGQLVQCRNALKPDGLFLGCLLGGATLAELRTALVNAESALTGTLSPRVAPMAEIRDTGALLQRAGFALPVADSNPFDVQYRSVHHLMRDLRAMGETNALAARHRAYPGRELFERLDQFYPDGTGPTGTITATFELIYLTGWAPAASQPKPLRPGSAQVHLSDVLPQRHSRQNTERDDTDN